MKYDITTFESDIKRLQPRAFDTYILPAFMIFYAIRSKHGTGRIARRIMFSAGCYMLYKNYFEYKKIMKTALQKIKRVQDGTA